MRQQMSEKLQDPGQQPVWISPNSEPSFASHLEGIRRHIHPPLIIITQAGSMQKGPRRSCGQPANSHWVKEGLPQSSQLGVLLFGMVAY